MSIQVRSGQVSVLGQFRTGCIKSGHVRSGQVKLGEVNSGQVKSGQIKSGQVKSGPGQVKSGQFMSRQVDTLCWERSIQDRSSKESSTLHCGQAPVHIEARKSPAD